MFQIKQNPTFSLIRLAFIGLIMCCFSIGLSAQEAIFIAGSAQVDITPSKSYPHYRGMSTGVHDRLYAKALVLGQGKERVALVVCDLLWVERSLSSAARLIISEATGMPYSNIIISGTHTHTGPAYHPNIIELTGTLRPPFDEDKYVSGTDPYRDSLAIKIAASVISASNSMERVHLESGSSEAKGLSFNRRYIMKDGKAVFNPGIGNKEAISPAGPVDPQVSMMMLRKLSDHSPLALLSNFGLHADTFGGSTFSADYPGFLAQALKACIGESALSIFATGPCGDINHVNVFAKDKKRLTSREIGDRLSEVIIKEIPSLKNVESSFLSMRSEYVYAPLQEYNTTELEWANNENVKPLHNESAFLERRRRLKLRSLERLRRTEAIAPTVEKEGWKIPLEIQVIGIGKDLAIVGLPGEIFAELGLTIKQSSPFKTTLVIELTNSHIAYVPTSKAFSQGSYETINSRLAPGGGEMMVETAIKLLKEIKREDN